MVGNSNGKPARPFKIIVSVSKAYLPVFFNWLLLFHHHCNDLTPLYILCLDNQTEFELTARRLECHRTLDFKNHSKYLWRDRVNVTFSLLSRGIDVLQSDTDAVWLQNPFPLLAAHSDADIVASRASFPVEVFKELGATICMGFILLRATTATQVMWRELTLAIANMDVPDDQRAFNLLLLQWGVVFSPRLSFPDNGSPSSVGKFVLKRTPVSVVVLPHHLIRRQCEHSSPKELLKGVVIHCASDKLGHAKEETHRVAGLWILRGDWDKIEATNYASVHSYLADLWGHD